MAKHIQPGTLAPDFTATDVLGQKHRLKDFQKKPLLIAFMRYSGCPWCNLAIHRLSVEYKLLQEQGCEVMVFVQSSAENITENIYGRHALTPPFPIIADPDKLVYEQYGVRASKMATFKSFAQIPHWVHSVRKEGFKQGTIDGDTFMVPAWFLISRGPKQKILRAHYTSSFYEHETFTEIYETLFAES